MEEKSNGDQLIKTQKILNNSLYQLFDLKP